MNKCTESAILGATDACEYVMTHCQDESENINFINFYYCDVNQSTLIIIILSILFVLFVFNFSGTTADIYVAPALEEITKKLNLSEAVAGASLLALATGAKDVISGLVAGRKESGGPSIAIGGIFGACLFTMTVVLARCIKGAGKIEIDAQSLKRNVFFMVVGILYFILLTIINKITWPLTLGFFAIYFVFLGYVIFKDRQKDGKHFSYREKCEKIKAFLLRRDKPDDDEEPILTHDGKDFKKLKLILKDLLSPWMLKIKERKRRSFGYPEEREEENKDGSEDSRDEKKKEDDKNSRFNKIKRIYNAPLLFIRNLTMPPFEEENWNRYYASVSPIFGLLFLIWQTGLIPVFNEKWYLWWSLYIVISCSLAIWMFLKSRNENLAKNNSGLFATITLIVSALWLNLVSTCFMDFLSLLTIISGLPLGFLSLTLLAWGNSLDDLFVDYTIAKSGHGSMAVVGVYGGSLFNLLIGFGGSLLVNTATKPLELNLYQIDSSNYGDKVSVMIIILCTLIVTVLTLLVAKVKNWVLGRYLMWFLIIFYIGFLIIVTILALI